ncbi:Cof-type HAD-IIB family hydrolase [Carnobacterium sp. ISL-102]|uniref:Cof-type HAD-IIB family hydrolase n=1 Tax=Carnobacterium sp. ISL-102 TaxID=2819142 RepID=UPI001BE8E70F|nr:Cof-type HAD-IIB family hydrolase [Carnobacterium sp. ISL-102]MBT2731664.1 Cof-type HAD-IIB family hydrolase [Carnobacterium sp. ISL-102]
MQKKMIFFDIDGTLVNNQKLIPDSTKLAIKMLKENGHEVAIATGRNLFMAQNIIDELEISHYIVCNGAAGYLHKEQVYENPLDPVQLEKLIKVADLNNHQIIYETPAKLRRRNELANVRITTAMKSVGYGVPKFDQDFYQHNSLVQCLLFYREDEKHLYESNQFSKFRFVRWHDSGVDVLPHDGSKANTVLRVALENGYDVENTIAFGDGLNDLEMIEKVGIGVAMGNALESVKLRADKVTKSCNEDGIYIALKELNLI